jgi:hypothetical protein
MADTIKIELTEKAKGLMGAVASMPDWGIEAFARGMDKANKMAVRNIMVKHLTGKGPFPVAEHKLGIVSGNLMTQSYASPATISGTTVASEIGSPVKYAEWHEFGLVFTRKGRTGTARLHTDAKGKLMRQIGHENLAVFAKAVHKAGRVKEVAWKSEDHEVTIPERAPFRTGIKEVLGDYGRIVSREVVAAWKAKT